GAPADRVRVTGNIKYDAVGPALPSPSLATLLGDGAAPMWVVGSTMAGEEEVVLSAFALARAGTPRLRLLLAPRHPERAPAVAALATRAGYGVARRSALGEGVWAEGDVLVLDTLGELAGAYAFATVVFVGGSLVPAGGHNVLEPAGAGRAV